MAQADEILKLNSIKNQKLSELKEIGISNKYLSDLERQKIMIK